MPGKIINVLWRACNNGLPTASELIKKHVNIDLMCPWCRSQLETPVHTLFLCTFATELWRKIGLQDINPGDESVTVLQILLNAFRSNNWDKRALIGLFCWGIWFRCNTWVWDKRSISVFGVQSMALQLLQDWRRSQEQNEDSDHRNQRARTPRWCKPLEGWIKVNIDVAYHHQSEFIGMGCVDRDDGSRFLHARSERMRGGMSTQEAEAWSFRAALLWMKQWKIQRCVFELDAKSVVDALHGIRGYSNFHTIIEECEEILKHFHEVLVVFENKSANQVVHELAQTAYSMSDPMEWVDRAPDFLICNLISDEY